MIDEKASRTPQRRHSEPQLGGISGTTEVAMATRYLIVGVDRGAIIPAKETDNVANRRAVS